MKDTPPEAMPIDLRAGLTESGVELHVRSRFLSAVDYVFGTKLIASNFRSLGEVRQFARDEAAKDALYVAVTKLLRERLADTPEALAPVISRWLAVESRRTESLIEIFAEAQDLIGREGREGASAAEEDSNQPSESRGPEIDETWLNHFARQAADVTTDDLKTVWAKILAHEIQKPGAVSLPTLRVLSEIDHSVASAFEACAEVNFNCEVLLGRPNRINFIAENESHYAQLSLLDEYGLISLSTMRSVKTYSIDGTPKDRFIVYGDLALRASGVGSDLGFALIPLTRPGRTFCSFLPAASPLDTLRMLGKWIADAETCVAIYAVKYAPDGSPELDGDPLETVPVNNQGSWE